MRTRRRLLDLRVLDLRVLVRTVTSSPECSDGWCGFCAVVARVLRALRQVDVDVAVASGAVSPPPGPEGFPVFMIQLKRLSGCAAGLLPGRLVLCAVLAAFAVLWWPAMRAGTADGCGGEWMVTWTILSSVFALFVVVVSIGEGRCRSCESCCLHRPPVVWSMLRRMWGDPDGRPKWSHLAVWLALLPVETMATPIVFPVAWLVRILRGRELPGTWD